jgi:uncharacterized membrane protein
MKRLERIWRHINIGTRALRRMFPADALQAIEAATRAVEARHAGEIRFAVEDSLPVPRLWRGVTPRERALEVFGQLGVWDTRDNNGVLIYVLLADRDVEIVADRGVGTGKVPPAEWEQCCQVMEAHFRDGRFREGALAGIEAVAAVLARHARHTPGPPDAGDELPNPPVVL